MTYIYSILRDGPVGLWSMDSLVGSVFTDSSGYGHDATKTGSPTNARPIVSGGISSQQLSGTTTISYPISNIMIQGRETWPFSLEAWIKPQNDDAVMAKIIARDSSGLFVDGTTIKFIANMSEQFTVQYEGFTPGHTYHVVGVYDGMSIILYINGEVVDSSDITVDEFSDTSTSLTTSVASPFVITIDTVAIYNHAISTDIVSRHYSNGISYPNVVNISSLNGGKVYEFYDDVSYVYSKQSFPDENGWSAGLFSGDVAEVDSSLVNMFSDTTSQYENGTWSYHISFEPFDSTVINGSKITWGYLGDIVVEYSLDGTTFNTLVSGDSPIGIQDISAGFSFEIRLTFNESITQSSMNNLNLVFYTSKNIKGTDESLIATIISPLAVTLSDSEYIPADFQDSNGIILSSTSGISIPHDDGIGYGSIEMEVFLSSIPASKTILYVNSASSQPSIVTNGSGQIVFSNLTGLYVDGVSVSSPYSIDTGKWHHIIATFSSTISDVYVANNVASSAGIAIRLAYLALYPQQISSADSLAIYHAWVGQPAVQIQEENIASISESTYTETGQAFRAYSFDWSITGAG
jgi:hypothetical protein